jgi:hypothetical protein
MSEGTGTPDAIKIRKEGIRDEPGWIRDGDGRSYSLANGPIRGGNEK